MLTLLPDTISLYASTSRDSVSSLVRNMKLEKSDLQFLINRMTKMTVDLNYSGGKIKTFSLITKDILTDSFRNAYLRLQNLFNAANATGLALNSMVDVFSSEILKLESDLNQLQLFIDNYEFLSGKDDLFNANYVEKFDSLINDYRFDNVTFEIPDRDGIKFSSVGNSFIDPAVGCLKMGSGQQSKNIIRNIKSIKIKSNYQNYITSSSSFKNLFNDNFSDSWSVTAKSPII